MVMKTNIVVELNERELDLLKEGHDVTQTIRTHAKEKDDKGGLFRKVRIFVVCRKIEV